MLFGCKDVIRILCADLTMSVFVSVLFSFFALCGVYPEGVSDE